MNWPTSVGISEVDFDVIMIGLSDDWGNKSERIIKLI